MSVTFYKRTYDPIAFLLQKTGINLSDEDRERLGRIKKGWDFYEGYHWEGVQDDGQPQVTINYCKTLINKFVVFEVGKGFSIKMKPEIEKLDDKNDPLDFLTEVWGYNKRDEKLFEMGQSKAVTGDVWIHPYFIPPTLNGKPNPDFDDPFDDYPDGKINILVLPSSICFPEYDSFNKDMLVKFTIMYMVKGSSVGRADEREVLYRQVHTKTDITEYVGDEVRKRIPNKYGMINIIHIKNVPLHGKTYGMSDIDDIIPINTELNLKKSNASEIIDYHSAPVTMVFGARVASLERGANKVWGGLPKDARVENLKLEGELDTAHVYTETLKKEMLEIMGIPLSALGGEMNISNTSAIALQIALMPLLERIEPKQKLDSEGLSMLNKMILKIGIKEGLISIPSGVKTKDFYYNEILFDSLLPKDVMAELQQIDAERKMLLTTREEALKRMGKDNIEQRIKDIDAEFAKNPEFYVNIKENKNGKDRELNAGYSNSPTPEAENIAELG